MCNNTGFCVVGNRDTILCIHRNRDIKAIARLMEYSIRVCLSFTLADQWGCCRYKLPRTFQMLAMAERGKWLVAPTI